MRISVVIAAALTVFAFAAAPASAEIVINKSIAGVEPGMSQEEVLDLIGDPNTTITNAAFDTTYTYRKLGIKVIFAPNGDTNDVTHIVVYKKGETTATGVGVGSTYKQMRAGVPGLHCVRAPNRVHRWCSKQTRRIFTNFTVTSTKKIREVTFGYRGD